MSRVHASARACATALAIAGGSIIVAGQAKPPAPPPLRNVTAFAAGATVVARPSEYGDTYTALMLLDESPKSIWASAEGAIVNQRVVVALAERSVLRSLVFDTAGIDGDGRGAKDVVVEVSDEGPTAGFAPVATVTLADKADGQRFAVTTERPGRWVALSVLNNHGAKDYVELAEFRGEGTQLTKTPASAIGGVYMTKWPGGQAAMHIRQDGTQISGCYEYNEGLLTGGIEDHLLRFTWREGDNYGPAIMVISPDGKRLNGLYWHGDRAEGQATWWDGERTAKTPGTCPHWKQTESPVERDLRDAKRTRLYGITFDFGSDHVRDESKATLDQVTASLKAHADWRVTIEGHTDAVGADAANQQLSERRAAAVRTYLTTAGIEATRLTARGFGAKQPVAGNDTELGRSQNRRVELVRE
jgi:outer membrane protein OmpA-like peptidoglycan-associated protein